MLIRIPNTDRPLFGLDAVVPAVLLLALAFGVLLFGPG
jgi:hypothetical protein